MTQGERVTGRGWRDGVRRCAPLIGLFICAFSNEARPQASPRPSTLDPQPSKDYLFFVASEGNDKIALVRFGPKGTSVDRDFRIGTNPTEVNGPHGLGVSPDGKSYYVSTAHGVPFGSLWKFSTADDAPIGRVLLGNFPATVQVSPNGAYAMVVNFNLHGDMVPSNVSVVYTDGMIEIARVQTCVWPLYTSTSPRDKRQARRPSSA